jgi:hypothetical protein
MYMYLGTAMGHFNGKREDVSACMMPMALL